MQQKPKWCYYIYTNAARTFVINLKSNYNSAHFYNQSAYKSEISR